MELIAGSASCGLVAAMAADLGIALVDRTVEHFPDGEIHVRLHRELRDADVSIVPPGCGFAWDGLCWDESALRAHACAGVANLERCSCVVAGESGEPRRGPVRTPT